MPRRTERRPRSRRARLIPWIAVLVVGVVALTGIAVAASRHHGTNTAADPTPIRPGTATSLAAEPTTPAPTATTAKPSTSSPRPTPTTSAPSPVAGPESIVIPALGISAPVVPVGVTGDGEVAIPEDVRTVGWYRYSPALPSTAGSTVLVGHVDSAVQGEGAFFMLHNLAAGDTIRIVRQGASELDFRVVALEQFPKTNVPLSALFSTTGPPRLTLITCGGAFDSSARSYLDNIVVTAVPA